MNDKRSFAMLMEIGDLVVQQGKEIEKLRETLTSIAEIYSHREYSIKEAAHILNRSTVTIHNWINSGKIPHTKLPDGSIIITKLNIDEYHGRRKRNVRIRNAAQLRKESRQTGNANPA